MSRQTALGPCPDAETLAAWADGTIYGADADGLEAHLADCQRCQAVLAAFAATEPVEAPIAVTDSEAETGAAVAAATVLPFRLRPSALRWAVPLIAGTAAASLILYFSWPKAPDLGPIAATSVARVEPRAPVNAPPPTSSNLPVQTPSIGPAPKPTQVANQKPAAKTDVAAPIVTPPLPPPLGTSAARSGQLGSPSPTVVLRPTPAAAPPASAGAAVSEQLRVIPPTMASQKTADAVQTEFGPADAVASVTLTPTRQGEAPRNPLKSIRWRVMLSGMVEKTLDGGKTWSRMAIDPAIRITSGASPSSVVCWLVGKAGAVMRSTDGGETWTRVASPDKADLVAITATDAQHATVETADGLHLTTTDGGQTWHR